MWANNQYQQHHDIEILPNGNILLISYDRKSQEEVLALGKIAHNGDFWSVMVRKKKVSANNLSPITNSLSGTHWANGARGGTLTAHSGSEKRTEFSLRHTATGDDSSTLGHHLGGGASLVSASKGNEVELSVFAAASSSNNMEKGDAKVQIQLFELDSKEKILEMDWRLRLSYQSTSRCIQ